jgi:probable HAF family extracellular repeat protein
MRKFAALLAFLLIITACSGGVNSSPNLPPQNPAAAQTVTVALQASGIAQTLPAVDGVSTSLTVPANNAPSGTMLSVTVSNSPIPGMPALPASRSKAFVYYGVTSSADATLNGLPALRVTLPSAPHDQGQFYAWAYSATQGWTDWGTVTVSGSTLTFGGTSKPILLNKGVQLTIVPFTASAGLSCACPSPSPTPSPAPSPTFTPSPVQTFSPSNMPHYRFVPLPPDFKPVEINDNGLIAGTVDTLEPGQINTTGKAALYNGHLHFLGTLPGDTQSFAYGINDKNQVVGYSYSPSSTRAVLYSDGHVYDLHAPGAARSINNDGLIAGDDIRVVSQTVRVTVALFDAGTCTPILYPFSDLPYSESRVGRLNDAGQYVGFFTITTGQVNVRNAYVASGTAIHPLGVGEANDINNHGDIVGFRVAFPSPPMPFIRNGANGAITVPVLPGFSSGEAVAINDAGQVVGNSYVYVAEGPGSKQAAFFYQSGKIASLEQISGKPDLAPIDINNRGEIVVYDISPNATAAGVLEPMR